MRWSRSGICSTSLESAAADHEVVTLDRRHAAQAPDPGVIAAETVALLDPQLGRVQEPGVRGRMCGQRGKHRHLVDDQRELVGLDAT